MGTGESFLCLIFLLRESGRGSFEELMRFRSEETWPPLGNLARERGERRTSNCISGAAE